MSRSSPSTGLTVEAGTDEQSEAVVQKHSSFDAAVPMSLISVAVFCLIVPGSALEKIAVAPALSKKRKEARTTSKVGKRGWRAGRGGDIFCDDLMVLIECGRGSK